MSIVLIGSTSGSITLQEPAVAGTTVLTLPATTGTVMVSGNMPAFGAYNTSNQSVTDSTYTKVTLGTEEFDTKSNFASGTFTPTVAGYYQINGSIYTGTSSITRAIAYIYKNGVGFKRGNDLTVGSAVNVSAVVYLNGSTDYVELYGYVTATTPLFYGTDTWFNGCLIRTA